MKDLAFTVRGAFRAAGGEAVGKAFAHRSRLPLRKILGKGGSSIKKCHSFCGRLSKRLDPAWFLRKRKQSSGRFSGSLENLLGESSRTGQSKDAKDGLP